MGLKLIVHIKTTLCKLQSLYGLSLRMQTEANLFSLLYYLQLKLTEIVKFVLQIQEYDISRRKIMHTQQQWMSPSLCSIFRPSFITNIL